MRNHVVAVFDGAHVVLYAGIAAVEIFFQRRQIVAPDAVECVCDHLRFMDGLARLVFGRGVACRLARAARAHGHETRHIEALVFNLQRVFRERVLFDAGDVLVHAVGKREDCRDSDNADAARECGHERAAFFREQVFERKRKRRKKRHARAAGCFGRAHKKGFS